MKKLKKINYLFFLSVLAFLVTTIGCTSNDPQSSDKIDVSFSVSNVTDGASSVISNKTKVKSEVVPETVNCSDLKADYVLYKIDDGDFQKIPVFYVNGSVWTNSIKLSAGAHKLVEFLVYSDNNTPDISNDDILLSAAPHIGSIYSGFVSSPLNQDFTVTVDKKNEIKMEVVCFDPKTFTNFGFTYFKLSEIEIHQLWFFADFCIKNKADYTGSPYTEQTGWSGNSGPFIDVPAILKVEVWKEGVLKNTFTNSVQGEKLAVNYADYLSQTDNYELKLYILVRQGTAFNYVYFKSWTFTDVSNIPDGGDGVIDGVLGNCYDPAHEPDFILAPWMNIPSTLTYTITASSSVLGAYLDATLSNIPIGYEIINGVYGTNCADHSVTINAGQSYDMDVYSSLYWDKLPLFARLVKWEKINWLYNHLDWYPGYHWYDVQGFIWLFDSPAWDGTALGSVPAKTALTQQMKTDAETYGVGYKVPPGGWATIIFVPKGTLPTAATPVIQTMFVKVDP